ncbi:MAG TPA: hypothetical protein VMV49_05775 [Candidatus Deferrimicrobium sp.]|nr:hypothetical protein [Candidatus Deferrimicrobium sp.]
MDIWGIKKIFGFYDRALEITYNNKVIFKREKPKSFRIGKSFFTELWDCDSECYTKNLRGCCKYIVDNVVISGGDFSKNKRSPIEHTYTIMVNGKEIPMEEMALKNPPCPYFSNNLCTVGFPQSVEDFYRRIPFICATTPGMFIQNRNNNLILIRKICNYKSQKIPYTPERLRLDKIVIQRFYDFYVKYGLETDYTFLHLLENTTYPIKKE